MTASLATQTAVKTLADIAGNPDHPQVLRAIQMLLNLSGPLPQIKVPASTNDVAEEQSVAMMQRFSSHRF